MEYKDINDFEVLYLIEENQSELKDVIFDKYKPILKKISYYYLDKLSNCGIEFDDVFQEALIGLNYAVDHFNDKRDCGFYTYAILCVRSKLSSFVKIQTGIRNKALNESLCFTPDDFDLENIGTQSFDEMHSYFYNRIINFKNSLDNIESQIFELRFNGFSGRDISDLLEINVRSVYRYVADIKNKLIIGGFRL